VDCWELDAGDERVYGVYGVLTCLLTKKLTSTMTLPLLSKAQPANPFSAEK